MAGLVGRAGHVQTPNPSGPLGDPELAAARRRGAVRARHVPVSVGHRPARRPPARLHRYRRVRPLQADDRTQRAAHDGFRRLRAAGRAVRRRDRPAPADHDRAERQRLSPPVAATGVGHDPRRSVSTTDPQYYRWTQWIFSQIFNAWLDPELDKARPISELVGEFESGSRDPRRSGLGRDARQRAQPDHR